MNVFLVVGIWKHYQKMLKDNDFKFSLSLFLSLSFSLCTSLSLLFLSLSSQKCAYFKHVHSFYFLCLADFALGH